MRAVLLLALAGLFFVPVPDLPVLVAHHRFADVFENSAHPVIFFAIAWLLQSLLVTRTARHAAWTLALCALAGGATELLQAQFGRDGSVVDFINDMLGAGAAVCVHAWRTAAVVPPRRRRLLLAGAISCVVLAALPIVLVSIAYAHRAASLPDLWRQDSLLDRFFSRDVTSDEFQGRALNEPWADWSAYSACMISVRNTDHDPVTFTVRIRHAAYSGKPAFHDFRFTVDGSASATFRLPLQALRDGAPRGPGWDLRQVRRVIVYRRRGATSQDRLELLGVRLVR